MDVLHINCAGLDVHKKTVVATVIVSNERDKPLKATQTFGTMTDDLLALSDWLMGYGVTHVAMESTGEYWKPIYNILEDNFEVWLVNAQHIKAVPGRKTDVKDSEWIAELLRYGLIRASFVPPKGQRELRELTRMRSTLKAPMATLSNQNTTITVNTDQPSPSTPKATIAALASASAASSPRPDVAGAAPSCISGSSRPSRARRSAE